MAAGGSGTVRASVRTLQQKGRGCLPGPPPSPAPPRWSQSWQRCFPLRRRAGRGVEGGASSLNSWAAAARKSCTLHAEQAQVVVSARTTTRAAHPAAAACAAWPPLPMCGRRWPAIMSWGKWEETRNARAGWGAPPILRLLAAGRRRSRAPAARTPPAATALRGSWRRTQ